MAVPMLVAGGLSLGANLFAQSRGHQATKKYNQYMGNMMDRREADIEGWFNKDYYQDFMNTDAARSVLSRLRSQYGDMIEGMDSSAIKSGATSEGKTAKKSEMAKRYAEALNNMVGYGMQRKDQAMGRRDQQMGALDNLRYGFMTNQYNQRLQSAANMGQNMTSSIGQLASSFMQPKP